MTKLWLLSELHTLTLAACSDALLNETIVLLGGPITKGVFNLVCPRVSLARISKQELPALEISWTKNVAVYKLFPDLDNMHSMCHHRKVVILVSCYYGSVFSVS